MTDEEIKIEKKRIWLSQVNFKKAYRYASEEEKKEVRRQNKRDSNWLDFQVQNPSINENFISFIQYNLHQLENSKNYLIFKNYRFSLEFFMINKKYFIKINFPNIHPDEDGHITVETNERSYWFFKDKLCQIK